MTDAELAGQGAEGLEIVPLLERPAAMGADA